MADDQYNHHETRSDEPSAAKSEVEAGDRGIFDFMGKKEEEGNKCEGEVKIAGEFDEKFKVSEEEDDTKKHETLQEKFQRSDRDGSGSSSGEEEIGEDGKKRKKKKGLKEKIAEKLPGEEKHTNDVPFEKCEEEKPVHEEAEEKKGLLDKIKEKLPGGAKKAEEVAAPPPTPAPAADYAAAPGAEEKEKKGLLDKIKEKMPGHSKGDEVEKEKEKECN
ncbi:dehydrin ERD14-like [Salvia miltiorrhiza]|uniref:dehydrin ERD14-like n=1 Tax=Salvia miltiorrhiza TaxID=226208 RepID=UPI0025ABE942|nr:dehydrin ERD14-like [Salvia miltiorrhiza]